MGLLCIQGEMSEDCYVYERKMDVYRRRKEGEGDYCVD